MRRRLTEADEAVWRALAAGVRPLRPSPAPHDAPTAPPPVPPVSPPPTPQPAAPRARATPTVSALAIGDRGRGVDDGRWRALAAERVAFARTLDLHGHTLEGAFRALAPFLRAASDDGVRVVEIVTGHGRLTGGGAIRRELPHWLNRPELRPLVVAARPASRRNDGAIRILLTRRRQR